MFEDWDPDAFPEEYRDAPRHPEYPPDEYDHYPKDYVYKSMEYYGGDIPSKSFQYIETKTPVTEAPNREEAVNKARERRRSRRRQRDEPAPPPQQICWSPLEAKYVQNVSSNAQVTSPREADVKARTRAEVQVWKPPSPTVDEPLQKDHVFDEEAYLSGYVPIMGGDPRPVPRPKKEKERAPWEKEAEHHEGEFDEEAYLTGKKKAVSTGITLKQIPKRELSLDHDERYPEHQDDKEFDEDSYLAGKVSILGGEGSNIPIAPKGPYRERAPWEKATEDEGHHFDEDAYLTGKVKVSAGNITLKSVPQRELVVSQEREEENNPAEEFDEDAYLSGKMGILGGVQAPVIPKAPKERAPWERDTRQEETREFDENAYLKIKTDYSGTQNEEAQQPETEFDEDAYLAGKMGILGGCQAPVAPKGPKERAPWEKEQAHDDGQDHFDEDAYLTGKKKVFSGGQITLRQVPQTEVYSMERRDEENEAQTGDQFDEDAYLSGKITILGGSGSQVPVKPKGPKERAPWEVEQAGEAGNDQFDEDSYLSGQRKTFTAGKITLRQVPAKEVYSMDRRDEENEAQTGDQFDEDAYLSGKVTILGGSGSQVPIKPKEPTKQPAPWEVQKQEESGQGEFDEDAYLGGQRSKVTVGNITLKSVPMRTRDQSSYKKDDDEDEEGEKVFDEDAYLSGRIPLVKGGEVDKKAIKGYAPQKKAEQLAPWQRATDEEDEEDKVFDERAYLQGTMTIGLRDSVDREGSLRRGSIKEKEVEQRPSWVKDTSEDDEDPDLEAHFSEQEYLSGRMGPQAVPSRAFRRLSRSLSRSESREGSFPKVEEVAQEEENGPEGEDEAFDEFVYVGKKIPSKLFSNLDNITKRVEEKVKHKGPEDPLDKLRKIVPADRSIDIDHAIETLAVDEHNPEQYLNKLKQTVDQKDAKTAAAETNQPTEEKPAEPAKCQTAEVTTTETTSTESKTVKVEGSSPGSPAGVKKKKKIIKKVVKKSEKTIKETKSESNAPDKVTSY